MIKHANDYGTAEVHKADFDRLCKLASLSDEDKELLYLRVGCNWQYEEIARHIGSKYGNRAADKPMWEGTMRARLKKILQTLRKIAKDEDFIE